MGELIEVKEDVNFKDQTKEFEGWRGDIYKDSLGNPTIGWGFKVDDPIISSVLHPDVVTGKRELTETEAQPIFDFRYDIAERDARDVIGSKFEEMDPEMQGIFTDMAYQMGKPTFSTFEKMLEGVNEGDLDKVAEEMKDSKWFKQSGRRSKQHYESMKKKAIKRGK